METMRLLIVTNEDAVFPLWFPPAFVALWILVMIILSRLGGWHELAKSYRAHDSRSGERFRFQSASLRWGTNYNGCLTLDVNMYGMYLSVFFPFRIAHPTLFIPWEDVIVKRLRGKWFPTVELSFVRDPTIPFMISRKLAAKLSQASGYRFEIETAAPPA